MKDRILKIINEEGLTASNFAKEIDVLASTISHISSGERNPSLDVVQKILAKYRSINPDWLLFGKGDMYRNEIVTNTIQPSKIVQTSIFDTIPTTPPAIEEQKFSEDTLIEKLDDKNAEEIPSTEISPSEAVCEKLNIENKIETLQAVANEKTVENIVIFYSDKTFKYFTPV